MTNITHSIITNALIIATNAWPVAVTNSLTPPTPQELTEQHIEMADRFVTHDMPHVRIYASAPIIEALKVMNKRIVELENKLEETK